MESFTLFISIFYAIIGVCIGAYYIGKKIQNRTPKNKDVNHNTKLGHGNIKALSDIRNQYFNIDEVQSDCFFIHSFMEEAFNIFLKLSPTMISTLTKADKRIVNINSMIDNELISEEDIKREIDAINDLLAYFIQASHQMIEKLEEVTKSHPDLSPSQVSYDAVKAYMGAVNVFSELTNEHSRINYETHYKLMKKYPNLVEPFRVIASKITYIFFINLITFSSKIDRSLFIYNLPYRYVR